MKIRFERNKTSSIIVMYSLYLYFLGLSLRNTSKALILFKDKQRSYVSVWNWIQRFGSCQIYNKRKRVTTFIIDETIIQIGSQQYWLWFCIEPIHSSVLGLYISEERREICLLLKNSCDLLLRIMENILYILMEVHGMMKHAMS
jgi:putative transposase